MTLLAGIDEAGYGPLLGPFVVGLAAFRVADAGAELWDALAPAVARPGGGRAGARLLVGDSKEVYARARGLARLEESVLAFLGLSGAAPEEDDALLARLGADMPPRWREAHPWYEPADGLPLAADAGRVAEGCARLREALADAGASMELLACACVVESEYNARVAETRNKAALAWERVAVFLGRVRALTPPDEIARVAVDRLGGRARYGELLRAAFPESFVWELERGAEESAYRVEGGGPALEVAFRVGADAQVLPVALASMAAKYVREVLMERFNAWWRRQGRDLPRTTGYRADAGVFLEASADLREALGIEPERLVRSR